MIFGAMKSVNASFMKEMPDDILSEISEYAVGEVLTCDGCERDFFRLKEKQGKQGKSADG